MTVVDVNTGKFTGSGGNLEETVTRNNLEAADEIVRQLRLRDIGGIIVVDFIDMVLESNRDLVLRRLAECLGRDRTRHQVAEVTSLGLVQMTRKRIGTGLLEAFSENCEHCQGRGVIVHDAPVTPRNGDDDRRTAAAARAVVVRRGGDDSQNNGNGARPSTPSPRDVAAVARPDSEPVVDLEPDLEPDRRPQTVETDRRPAAETSSWSPIVAPGRRPRSTVRRHSQSPRSHNTDGRRRHSQQLRRQLQLTSHVRGVTPAPRSHVVVEAAAPAVVVRTRRRAASRPAGPPVEIVRPSRITRRIATVPRPGEPTYPTSSMFRSSARAPASAERSNVLASGTAVRSIDPRRSMRPHEF